MSFSSSIKEELCAVRDMPECCVHSMAYGMLLFGRMFNSRGISILTEHRCVAEKYALLLKLTAGYDAKIHVSSAEKYSISIDNKEEISKILSVFSVSENESFLRINRGNLLNEHDDKRSEIMNCCNGSFLRGAFLSCGTVCDPTKSYHLEFVVPYKTLSMDLMKILTEYNLKAKHMVRRGVNVIYLKDSESIEDLLNIMGAQMSAFEIMNIKIEKDVRNTSNRRANFSYANISRTAYAAYDQIEAIKKMISKGTFNILSADLKRIAQLRIDNPEMSLRELGEICDPPLSRSAVNYRLKRIAAYCDKTVEEIMESTAGAVKGSSFNASSK